MDVRDVYITKEVSEILGFTSPYLIRFAKKAGLSESEMREAGKRNYIFSKEAVKKLKAIKEK